MKWFKKFLDNRLEMIWQAIEYDKDINPIEEIKKIESAKELLKLYKLNK